MAGFGIIEGTAIRCNCCGRNKKVAEIHSEPGSIELVSRHHGTNHIAKLGAKEILESLSGTITKDGISMWVSALYKG